MQEFVKNGLDMYRLSKKMGDDYLCQLYWSSAQIITEHLYDEYRDEQEEFEVDGDDGEMPEQSSTAY